MIFLLTGFLWYSHNFGVFFKGNVVFFGDLFRIDKPQSQKNKEFLYVEGPALLEMLCL